MFSDWKIQLEKVQLTQELRGYCDATTRTQATIVWFPEDTCTTFQVAKIHARMIKFHQKHFVESIPFINVNPGKIKHSNYKFKNIHNIENKLTRFQIYPDTKIQQANLQNTRFRSSCRIRKWFRYEHRKLNRTPDDHNSLIH